jgi:hypothetical protein
MQVANINPAQAQINPLTAFSQGRTATAQQPMNLRVGASPAMMQGNALSVGRNLNPVQGRIERIDYHKDQRERDAYRRELEKKFVDQQITQENNALLAQQDIDKQKLLHQQGLEDKLLDHENMLEREGLGRKHDTNLEGLRQENKYKALEFEDSLRRKFRQEGRDYDEDQREMLQGNWGAHIQRMADDWVNWNKEGPGSDREKFRNAQRNAYITELMGNKEIKQAFRDKYGKRYSSVDSNGQLVVNEFHPMFSKGLRKFIEQEAFSEADFQSFLLPLEIAEQNRRAKVYHLAIQTAFQNRLLIEPNAPGGDTIRGKMGIPTMQEGVNNGTIDPALLTGGLKDSTTGELKDPPPPPAEGDNPFIAQDIYGAAKNIGNALVPDDMDLGDAAGLGTGALIAEQTTKVDKNDIPKMGELRPKGKAERAKSPYGGPTSKAKNAYEKRKLQVVRDAAKDLNLNLGNLSDQEIKDMDPVELRRKLVASRRGIITKYLNKGTLSNVLKNKYAKMLGKGTMYLGAVAIGHDLITAMTDEDARAMIAGNKVAEVINEGIDAGGSAGVSKGDDGVIRFN